MIPNNLHLSCVCLLHLASGTAAHKYIVVILSGFPVSPKHTECTAHGDDQMKLLSPSRAQIFSPSACLSYEGNSKPDGTGSPLSHGLTHTRLTQQEVVLKVSLNASSIRERIRMFDSNCICLC